MEQDEENQVFLSSIRDIPEHPAVAQHIAESKARTVSWSDDDMLAIDNEFRAKYGLPPRTMDEFKK